MIHLTHLTISQLKSIIAIKEQIETLQSEIDSITAGGPEIATPATVEAPTIKHPRSAAVRARMAASQKARWAKIKANDATDSEKPAKKGKRKLSAAHRRKLIKALAKARKIRLANLKASKLTTKLAKKMDWRSSPSVRAKLAAAAKARWAKVRAEGKTRL